MVRRVVNAERASDVDIPTAHIGTAGNVLHKIALAELKPVEVCQILELFVRVVIVVVHVVHTRIELGGAAGCHGGRAL